MIALAENSYGKSSVRVMKVKRDRPSHSVLEWKVEVLLSGDFESCFISGDNRAILPTDTMKNTVYSRARESQAECIEDFALELAQFFLSRNPQVQEVAIQIASTSWEHASLEGKPHPSTFLRGSSEEETTTVTCAQGGRASVTSGLDHLIILKTAQSGFEGFVRDSLTTLPETDDRLLGTSLRARWTYRSYQDYRDYHSGALPFGQLRSKLRAALLDAFAGHDSKSVQHTLYAMAQAALEAAPEILDVELAMPNKHCLLVDLSRFGQTNPNEIFVPTDEPYGNIVARIVRK
ncbi:MAG: urate oxidase [Acidobacteriaceae bacterium]